MSVTPVTYSGEVTEKANGRIVIRPGAGDRSGVERIEIYAADGAGHTSLPEMGDEASVTLEVTKPVAPLASITRIDGKPDVVGADGLVHGDVLPERPGAPRLAPAPPGAPNVVGVATPVVERRSPPLP